MKPRPALRTALPLALLALGLFALARAAFLAAPHRPAGEGSPGAAAGAVRSTPLSGPRGGTGAPPPVSGKTSHSGGDGATARAEAEGLAVSFHVEGEGPARRAVLRVTDARSGEPVRNVRPLAFLTRRRPKAAPAPDEAACRASIGEFLGGKVWARPDVDLNTFYLLALNTDNTISVINPRVAFLPTRLHALVSLAAVPEDFALDADGKRLYVTLPGRDVLAVVDTARFLVRANVAVGDGPGPVRVAPDGGTVWVANEGDGTVSVVDTATLKVLAHVPSGPGPHGMVFARGGRDLWVTNGRGSAVTVIDVGSREVVQRPEVGRGAAGIDASDAAGLVAVAVERSGEVRLFEAAHRQEVRLVALRPGVGALRFDPAGRRLFVANPAAGTLSVLDPREGRLLRTVEGLVGPATPVLTEHYLFLAGKTAASPVEAIALSSLEEGSGEAVVVRLEDGGPLPRGSGDGAPGEDAPARFRPPLPPRSLVPGPDGRSLYVGDPARRAIRAYLEGQSAPAGSLVNYGVEPRRLLFLDLSLKEMAAGTFAVPFEAPHGGLHDVRVLLWRDGRPGVAVCLEARLDGPDPDAGPTFGLTLAPRFDPSLPLIAGEPATLPFDLTDRATGRAPKRSRFPVLFFRMPGTWQWRGEARFDARKGGFVVEVTPPTRGEYRLVVLPDSPDAPPGSFPVVTLKATESRGGRRQGMPRKGRNSARAWRAQGQGRQFLRGGAREPQRPRGPGEGDGGGGW